MICWGILRPTASEGEDSGPKNSLRQEKKKKIKPCKWQPLETSSMKTTVTQQEKCIFEKVYF
jgi:hypothetical protein